MAVGDLLDRVLEREARSGPRHARPRGLKLISHWEPAYSQLAVMISMPNAFSWSTSSWMKGTYVFRPGLKIW